jgi:WD40 repeat protein
VEGKGDGENGKGQEEEEEEGESERVKFAGRLCGHSATVRSLAWLGNEGGRGDLLTGGADGNICQYRLETFGYRPTSVTRAHDYSVMHMAWDGERLVTASDDSTFKTWSFQEFVAAVPRGYV